MRPLRLWSVVDVPLLTLLLGALAACGPAAATDQVATASGGKAAPTASASRGAFDAEQGRKFAQCMRDNGIPDFPDPDPNGGGGMRGLLSNSNIDLSNSNIDRDKLRQAMSACRSLLPNGGQRPQLDAAQLEQLRQWAQCMRDNGVDVPDPDPNGGGFGFGGGDGQRAIDRSSPAFQKAMQACQDKFVFRRRSNR